MRCDPTKPGNFPYFTIIISLVQIGEFEVDQGKINEPRLGVFIYYYTLNSDDPNVRPYSIDSFNENTLCTPFLLSPWHREEVWRYLLYQFNHAGWTHLFSNLLFQFSG